MIKREVISCPILSLFFVVLNACTTVAVSPSDNIKSTLPSIITLVDKQNIRSQGFELKDGQLHFSENGQRISISRLDVYQIETIDRKKNLLKYTLSGATFGGLVGLKEILSASASSAGWEIIAFPLIVLSTSVIAGAGAYVIADRTYYDVNPLNLTQKTEYSSTLFSTKLDGIKGYDEKRKRYHFGVNLGGGYSRLPAISKNIDSVAQGRPEDSIMANIEFGKWINSNTAWGANIFMLNASNFGGDKYFVTRGIFSLGPQIIHFPSRYGVYYKAAANYGVYFESIEDSTQLDSSGIGKIVYENSFNTVSASGSIGYAYTLNRRINISAEFIGRVNYIGNNNSAGMLSLLIGLHWY